MKKICILSTVNIKHMTLISLYTDFLEKNNIAYDIIYIDKYGVEEEINAEKIYRYYLPINPAWPFLWKVCRYWKFKAYAKRLLVDNGYDFLIVWNSFTAFMFFDYLTRQQRGKYCLNIRDYAQERFFPVYWVMKKVIKASSFSTISSRGFEKFLPRHNYVCVHSLNNKILSQCSPRTKKRVKEERIRISYIGYLSYPYVENCYKFINALGNDERYLLQFIGIGSQKIETYASSQKINNVICRPSFEPHQTQGYLETTDILYNLYDVGYLAVDTALSIKLYYAIYLHLPILVFKNTYMETISELCGIGFAIEKGRDFSGLGERLYNWYHNLDLSVVSEKCDAFKEEIIASQNHLKLQMTRHFLHKGDSLP